jgi:hypothetical protein
MLDRYRDLTDGLLESPTLVRQAVAEGSTSPEVLALLRELRFREAVQLSRVQTVMRERKARLGRIDTAMQQAAQAGQAEASADELITQFGVDRGELVSVLINLTLMDWDRPVDDPVRGEITLADEIEHHLDWDEDLLERLRAAAR